MKSRLPQSPERGGKVVRNAKQIVAPLILVLLAMMSTQLARAESDSNHNEQLTGTLSYWFVGHRGQTDDQGRLLVWEAEVQGAFTGSMRWWFVNPSPVSEITFQGGRVTFYAARWELWENGELLLAGESAGKTDFRDGADGMWDGHGRVKEAAGKYEFLLGRSVYETGPVIIGSDPPKSYSGTGMFLVY